jgi:hypothetical protein
LVKDEEELLVYKNMPKGDLTTALHKKTVEVEEGLASLDWITRLKIAIGVAEALCFLHDECNPPLVHRYAVCYMLLYLFAAICHVMLM